MESTAFSRSRALNISRISSLFVLIVLVTETQSMINRSRLRVREEAVRVKLIMLFLFGIRQSTNQRPVHRMNLL